MKWIERMQEKSVDERRRKAFTISVIATICIALAWIVGEGAMDRSENTESAINPFGDVAAMFAPLVEPLGEIVEKFKSNFSR